MPPLLLYETLNLCKLHAPTSQLEETSPEEWFRNLDAAS